MKKIADMTDEELLKEMDEYAKWGELGGEDPYWVALCEERNRRGLRKKKDETELFEDEAKSTIRLVNRLRTLGIPTVEKTQLLKKLNRELFVHMKPFLYKEIRLRRKKNERPKRYERYDR